MGETTSAGDDCGGFSTRGNRARSEPSPAALRSALDAVVRASLPPVSALLSVLFAVFAVGHNLLLSPPVAAPLTFLAAGTAVIFLTLYVVLRRLSVPSSWTHPLGAGMATLVLLNCLLTLSLLSEPLQTTNVMLFLVGVGSLFLSTRWLVMVIGATLLGWGYVVWEAPPSPTWRHFGFGLLLATVLAVALHTVRVRTVRHLLWLRLEDERRQRELQEAGLTVREELEARVQERTAELVAANAALRAENSERRRAEAALRESEEQYRDLVENINDVIYSQDEQGRVTYVSPIVEPLSGYHPTEIVGHSFTEFIHPDDLPSILASVQRTLAGQLEPSEFRVVTKTGAVRWAHSSSRPIVREERVVGLRGVIADITDRKRAETHTQALLAIADDISGTLDLHELLERVQRRTAEVLPCEIVATFYWQPQSKTFRLISQYGLPVILLPHAEVLAFPPDEPFGGRVASGHTVVMNEITAQSPFLADVLSHFGITALVAVPLRVQGRHLGALVACTTRTGQRFDANQVELCNGIARQLAVGIEATELYRRQQEEAEDAAVLARVGQEMIASLNTPSVLAHFCQLTVEALAGSCGCTFLWQPEYEAYTVVARWGFSQEHQALLDVFRLPEKTVVDLVSLLHSDEVAGMYGPVFPTLIPKDLLMRFGLETAIFLRLQRGQDFLGFQVCGYKEQTEFTARHYRIARGIAQTAALALVNIELLDELKRANRIKEDFVGTMSHELRTPLNVIMGYTQLMAEETFGSLTAEQADVLERISKNTTDLLDLINATLDLSRLQNQQRLSLTVQEIRGAELLAELESEMRQLQRKPSVGLQWQIMPTLPSLYTDKVKLKMVLKNLITNALKFTDAGLITVSARPQQGGVEFGVTDTGIGIPREALSIIFEPFRQVDGSSTRRHGGVGLGLYIVRQLVELLGGTVTVESEVGSGSTFRVWIPAGTHDGEREKTGNGLLPAESPETGV